MPSCAELGDGLEGLHVAEVVAGEEEALGLDVLGQGADDDPLVHAGGPHLDHVATRLLDQAVALGEIAQPRLEPVVRRDRVVEPPCVDGDREALVLDEGVGRVRLAQHPRQVTQEAGQSLGRAR